MGTFFYFRRRVTSVGFLFMGSIFLLCLCISPLRAQGPIGDPNEVWVNTSSGDTICVGEEVLIQVSISNSTQITGVVLTFSIYSMDGVEWDWLTQPDGKNVSIVPDSRWDEYFGYVLTNYATDPPNGDQGDSIFVSFFEPFTIMPAGPLEHMLNIHLKPTRTGTLCIDSSFIPPSDPQWNYHAMGELIQPTWGGPYCFTVIEAPTGDINCDGKADVGDAVYLINWIFRYGPAPCR